MDTNTSQVAIRSVKEALSRLNPQRADSRKDWVTVGMAIHKTFAGAEDGLSIWIDWSRQSPKFTEGECERLWSEFDSSREDGVNLGTIRRWANEDSYKPEVEQPTQHEEDVVELKAAEMREATRKLKLGMGLVIQPPTMSKPPQSLDSLILASASKIGGEAVARWFYKEAKGEDVLAVVRFQPQMRKKEYRQFHKSGGIWYIGGIESDCPLYGLPDVLRSAATNPIAVCEGEKAADAARRLGLMATTSCQGAQSPGKTDWTPLLGREVWIFPDNDGDGEKFARTVARILLTASGTQVVKVIHVPGLPTKGDLYDFEQQARPLSELHHLAEATPNTERFDILGGPVLLDMSDVECTEIEWLWPGKIPKGRLTMIVGRPGLGKSFMTSGDFAARVTRGAEWPDGAACPSGQVLIISGEDAANDTLKPRLLAHGADLSRGKIKMLAVTHRPRSDGSMEEHAFTLDDVPALEATLAQMPDCRLVIIDPIGSFMGGKVDSGRDNEVRAILAPVARVAEKHNVAVIVVMHRRKDNGGNNADATAMGSVAFTGIARMVWHVVQDAKDRDRVLFLPGKTNITKRPPGMAFRITGNPAALVWEAEPLDMHADDAIQEEAEHKSGGRKKSEIEEWLIQTLLGGSTSVKDLKADAKDAGFNWATVAATADKIPGLTKYKDAGAKAWVWAINAEETTEDATGEQTGS